MRENITPEAQQTFNDIQQYFSQGAAAFGVQIEKNQKLKFQDGSEVIVPVRLSELGGPGGMIVFHSIQYSEELFGRLRNIDTAFTFMDAPAFSADVELEDFGQLFRDWGMQKE